MPDFYGLPVRSLENEHLRLEFLAEAGPRIVRLFMHGSDENQLVELPDISWDTIHGAYHVRGGHRLWYGPEMPDKTYFPDDSGLVISEIDGGVRLIQPTEAATGIRKSMEIILQPGQPRLTIHHILTNEGQWPVELAPWAITQLPLGGVALLPQQVGGIAGDPYLPNRQLVLWPYTRWQDPRLVLEDDLLLIKAEAALPPVKVGYYNRAGWLGYLRNQVLFSKRFQTDPDLLYPDFGCNSECYCNNQFIEVETLGAMTRLEPGQEVLHDEIWEFTHLQETSMDLAALRQLIKQTGLKAG